MLRQSLNLQMVMGLVMKYQPLKSKTIIVLLYVVPNYLPFVMFILRHYDWALALFSRTN